MLSPSSDRSASADDARLVVRDGRIVTRAGTDIRLRGFNVIPVWGTAPGQTWSFDHYRRMRRAGFNTVRFVLHWDDLEPREGHLDRRHLRTLDTAIRRARAARLRVVLDMLHVYLGEERFPRWARTGDALATLEQRAKPMLVRLARRFRDEPAVVAYDLINEPPSHPLDQNRVLRLYDDLITAVRRVAPEKIIMFEPAYGDTSMAGADLSLLRDKRNLVFTLHDYYAGGAGHGYDAVGTQARHLGARYAWDGTTGYAGTAAELEQHLRVNLDVMRAAGIPVWIGEFGVNPRAERASQWIRDKVDLFERHDVGWAWWVYGSEGSLAPLTSDTRRFRPFVTLLREATR